MAETFDPRQPFTRADLQRAGLRETVTRRVEHIKLMTGVWIHRDAHDDLSLVKAALLIHPPDAFASHLSAAAVLGLPVPEHPFAHVTVRRPQDRHFRPQIKSHVTRRRRNVIVVKGIRTTDPIATFIDCAGWLSLLDMIVLGDALVRTFDVTAAELRRACDRSTDYYAGLARNAAAYVRDGVDSPMETRLRMLIVLAGLPEPVVNYRVYWENGVLRRRFDLCWPGIKLIVEYDGRQHAESTRQWLGDLERREEFDDEGWRILVVTAEGIYRTPERTLERVRRQLIARGMPGVPPLDDAWREHFGF
ncbi:hypothetical protein BH11ACT8_BH11ACT8_10210 [soil metagenome]